MPEAIEIYVEPGTGNFIYKPAVYHTRQKAPIAWHANGNFAIQFPGATPLEKVRLQSRANVIEARVRPEAPSGVYHYAVAVAVGDQVFLDTHCPTIVIG